MQFVNAMNGRGPNAMKTLARKVYRKMRALRPSRVNKLDLQDSYPRLTRSLKCATDIDKAIADAVGGEFEAIGILELETLKYFGLKEDSYVIDVGCGSGRLAKPVSISDGQVPGHRYHSRVSRVRPPDCHEGRLAVRGRTGFKHP